MSKKLPKIPQSSHVRLNKRETIAMRGINFSDIIQDGDLAASKNISARRYPYISTRNARRKVEGVGADGYTKCIALSKWNDKLITVCEDNAGEHTITYYGVGSDKRAISGTDLSTTVPKQFAAVNTKMVVWPDKLYIDFSMDHPVLDELYLNLWVTANTNPIEFYDDGYNSGIQFPIGLAWVIDYFYDGQQIEISNCAETHNNGVFRIEEVVKHNLSLLFPHGTFYNSNEMGRTIYFTQNVPDMDYICESQNRLWGCESASQTIRCSALGNPKDFVTKEGTAEDSWEVAVGSDSDFTGCFRLSSGVLFWKQAKLHKVLGSYPADYTVFSYDYEGLQDGSAGSMQVVNDTLFYMGTHGVYAYNGGMPTSISEVFGEKLFTDGIAGTDGDSLYLSVRDGDNYRLLVYDMRRNIWLEEDDIRCVSFARINDELYFADDNGDVWLADSGEEDPDVEWFAQFTPFYETIEGHKIYSRILLRAEVPKGSYMNVNVRLDGRPWQTVGRIVGNKRDLVEMRVPLMRCDKFELKLEGKGPCVVHSILREFSVGSEV